MFLLSFCFVSYRFLSSCARGVQLLQDLEGLHGARERVDAVLARRGAAAERVHEPGRARRKARFAFAFTSPSLFFCFRLYIRINTTVQYMYSTVHTLCSAASDVLR